MHIYKLYFLALVIIFSTSCSSTESYSDYVNPLQGTLSTFELSNGNTYPAVAVPWGMNFWTPQTGTNTSGWQYTFQDSVIRGFKQTHQPSPWINDYGCFSIMPVAGKLKTREQERESVFSHVNEISKPYYYSTYLEDFHITSEMTPTDRGAIFRFTFPANQDGYIVTDAFPKGSEVIIDTLQNRILGISKYYAPNNKANLPENFASYWVIQLPEKPLAVGCYDQKQNYEGIAELKGHHVGAYVRVNQERKKTIEIKTASSFISMDQALINLNRELGDKDFEDVKKEAKQRWDQLLGSIEIDAVSEEQKRTFYTALYRIYLFPRKIHEFDSNGKMIHYSPLNGQTLDGPFYTDNGFWDTFRGVHPFYTIIKPSFSNEFIEGLLNYYREGGWLPEWFSPGYKDCMIGQHSAAVIIDAYLKDIKKYDVDLAWEAIVKGANNEGPIEALGRDGVYYYDSLGYIPYDAGHTESVSKTMEYAYNDFCIYMLGKELGKPESEISFYLERAFYYKNIFDTTINFPRPKDLKGNWIEPFYEDDWGKAFTEGSSWHWIWSVFHDIEGLIELMGGRKILEEKLDTMLAAEPTFRRLHDNKVIHEMTEMVVGGMGQYAHGNQPSQHALYLYNYAGTPHKTQKNVRHVMNHLYHSGPDGLCGDEDNGQTSAWYVLSALGFYSVAPGTGEYIIGSPLFNKVKIHLENGNIFRIIAENNSTENLYIQSVKLNEETLNRCFIRHEEIMNGGTLVFVMGNSPNSELWISSTERPFSLTSYLKNLSEE